MQATLSNLNHLRVLRLLLRDPNLSRASEKLGLTQPTVSSALAQLRDYFKDPLLVRVGNRMELTERARELVDPLEAVFHAFDNLAQTGGLDLAEIRRNIVIATTDYGTAITLPVIVPHFQRIAPGISMQFIDMPERTTALQRANEIDFYLLPNVLLQWREFQNMKFSALYRDVFVHVVHSGHQFAGCDAISEADLASEGFAIYHLGLEPWNSAIGQPMARFGEGRRVILRLQQFSLLAFAAAKASCVVSMPLRLARMMQDAYDLKILGETIPPFEFDFCLAWDPLRQTDVVHRWFRREMRRLLAEQAGDDPAQVHAG